MYVKLSQIRTQSKLYTKPHKKTKNNKNLKIHYPNQNEEVQLCGNKQHI